MPIWFELVRRRLLKDQGDEKEDLSPALMILKLTFQNFKGN